MLKWSYKYKLDDFQDFFYKIVPYVDTLNDYRQRLWIPHNMKYDYFGKIEYSKLKIYQFDEGLFKKSIIAVIKGRLKDETLEITYKAYSFFPQIFNVLMLNLFGFTVILNYNLYLGILVLLIGYFQFIYTIATIIAKKKEFKKLMDSILKK